MVVSSTLAMTVNVMTRAPPLFPFPLEEIRILTLRRPLPKSVPRAGLAVLLVRPPNLSRENGSV